MSTSDSGSTSSESSHAIDSPPLPPSLPPQPTVQRRDLIPPRYASRHGSGSSSRAANAATSSYMSQDRSSRSFNSNPVTASMTPEARRQSMIAMDRKRRLTGSGSNYEHIRRRYSPAEFVTRTGSQESPPAVDLPRPMLPPSRPTQNGGGPHEVVDLTASSPPAPPPHSPPRHNQASRTSSSSSRRYVVPSWQPDAEATHCPICKKQFTWMFRRHHCRKCGRVVCDTCSPHRITIPRQFIVNPPGPGMGSSPPQGEIETIDLTGEDDEEGAFRAHRRSRNASLLAMDGGEKVRLCNPCVPDPQPDPLPNFPPFLEDGALGAFGVRPPLPGNQAPGTVHTNIFGQPRRTHNPPFPQTQRDAIDAGRIDYSTSLGSRPRPSAIPNPYAMYFDSQQGTGVNPSRGSNLFPSSQPANNPLPQLPTLGQFPPAAYGHGRYSSLDIQHRPQPSLYGRPRGSSMFDLDARPGMMSSASHSRPSASHPSRPRLHERDICPVCRRALPARGENGDESAREAHIMACITARDPSSAAAGEGGSTSGGRIHMVAFIASEKDCLGEEGNTPECSICMVEYDVGDELARLECFCKFHKECIVSWLNRKAECPVHKASRFNI